MLSFATSWDEIGTKLKEVEKNDLRLNLAKGKIRNST